MADDGVTYHKSSSSKLMSLKDCTVSLFYRKPDNKHQFEHTNANNQRKC